MRRLLFGTLIHCRVLASYSEHIDSGAAIWSDRSLRGSEVAHRPPVPNRSCSCTRILLFYRCAIPLQIEHADHQRRAPEVDRLVLMHRSRAPVPSQPCRLSARDCAVAGLHTAGGAVALCFPSPYFPLSRHLHSPDNNQLLLNCARTLRQLRASRSSLEAAAHAGLLGRLLGVGVE